MYYCNNTATLFDNACVAVGYEALRGSTTPANNTGNGITAIGYRTLYSNSTGNYNSALGTTALYANTTGSNNTALGYAAITLNTTGAFNTATGVMALNSSTTANNNTCSGYQSMAATTNGSDNTASGYTALKNNTTGFRNTVYGSVSMVNNTTGNYNTAVGYNTGPNSANLSNNNCFGIDATGTANDQVRVGNVYVNSIGGQVGWTTLSDGRFKEQVQENVAGLSFINQLRPVTYRVNRDKMNTYLGIKPSMPGQPLSDVTTGFIAQEVETAAHKAGFTFSGVDRPKNETDYYGLRYAEFVVPLVKAVQELAKENEELKKRIELLERR
jgi:hypothetical protein